MRLSASMDSQLPWLQRYIAGAVRRNLCTNITCTTCGATEFREGLLAALSVEGGILAGARLTELQAHTLTQALTFLRPNLDDDWRFVSAVRLILYDIERAVGPLVFRERLRPMLDGTWVGSTLAAMEAHERARMEARRRHEEENDPERIKQRREEKRRLKQEQHELRLAKQKERARLWHQAHPEGGA